MAGVQYDVRANLQTAGSFQREAAAMARGADRVGKSYASMSDRLVTAGERVRGTFGQTAREFARMGAMAGAGALVGGIAAAAREGVRFNSAMEQGSLGLGTMYTTFGLATNSAAVMRGEMTEFAKSVELAQSMQQELFDIAKASPATFEDMTAAYQAMAPGVSGVTGDLMRQRDLMEKIAVLGFTTGGDFKQLGADVGRIVQGVAGQDVAVFRTLAPNIKKAFEEATGEVASADFAQQFNKLAKADGEAALAIFEGALAGVSDEINTAFGQSFEGVMATGISELQVLAGEFGKPLMESMKRAALRATGPGGLFEGEGLRNAASFAGQQLAAAADALFMKLEAGAKYVRDNWEMIATQIQQAGVAAGAALKAAAVVATARMVAGNAMIIAGKGAAAAQAVGGAGRAMRERVGKRMQTEHLRRGRRLRERGPSGAQKAMGTLAGLFGAKLGPSLDRTILRVGTLATVTATAGLALGGIALAFGGVALVVGGLAAYVSSSWDEIKKSIVGAIESGRITLVPMITSLYTFYERLRLVGQAIFGNVDAAGVMAGGLDMMTGAIDFASMVLGGMIEVVAYGIEAFGAFRLAFSALLQLIGDGLRVMAKIPKVGEGLDGAIGSIETMSRAQHDSAQSTFETARRFHDAAGAIKDAQLSPMQFEAAKKKAKSLEGALSDMLEGKGKDGNGRGRGGTRINKVEIVVNTADPDPDRLFAGLLRKAESMSDRRVQAYDALEQGT